MTHDDPRPLPAQPADWPDELVAVERLAARGGAEVWRALLDGRDVAVRLVPAGETALAAELEVLASVDIEGIARVLAHGARPGGGAWLAREWIDGAPLDRWAADRDEAAVGAALAALAERLEALHAAGFAHGDLSVDNVLMDADGRPTLADFGLAGRVGAAASGVAATGSLYGIAPERLAGAPPSAAADLFALGAVIHALFARGRRSARDFYARFPAQPFFDAAGVGPDALPAWARDVVEALVARRPERRPSSAAEVARRLGARLGLPSSGTAPPSLEPPASLGREPFLRWLVGGLDPAPREALAVVLPAADDALPTVDALRLRATIAGLETRTLELDAELAALADDGALDRWAAALAAGAGEAILFVAVTAPSALAGAALRRLARARSRVDGAPRLVVVGPDLGLGRDAAADPSGAWRIDHAPAARARDVDEFLGSRVDAGSDERREEVAERLARASAGGTAALGRLLAALREREWLVPVGDRWTLRGGPLPDLGRLSVGDVGLPADPLARHLLALAAAAPDGEPTERVPAVLGVDPAECAATLRTLERAGWIERRSGRVRVLRAVRPGALLDRAERAPLHARRAALRAAAGEPAAATWLDRWIASQDDRATLAQEWRERNAERRDAGAAEFVLAELDALGAADAGAPPDVDVERALAWGSLGNAVEAERALGEHPEGGSASILARVELARAQIARIRNAAERARAHFRRAAELDPSAALDAALGEVQLDLALGRDADVVERVDAAERGASVDDRKAGWRTWCDLGRLRAVARLRAGEPEAARAELEDWLARARARGDAVAEGTLSMNLATLERRTGDGAVAIALFRRAADALRSTGRVASEAQARAQLGGALREAGALTAAEPELRRALSVRERLGDAAGAANLRGLFALLTAERGHVAAAIGELERAVEGLAAGQRRVSGPLLLARGDVQRARVGRPPLADGPQDEGDAAVDPRVFLDRARAAALRGEDDRAAALLGRADSLAARLRQEPVRAEAAFVAAALDADGASPGPHGTPSGATGGLLAQDVRLWTALCGDDVDALEELARELTSAGRDDRAARAWLAVAARASDDARAAAARAAADELLEACCAGLESPERARLRHALLALPDPRPGDLDQRATTDADEDAYEMEILELLELNHRLVEQEDLDGLLTEIVSSACAVTGAERGFLVLEEEGRLRLDTATDFARGDIAADDVALSTSVVREALTTMQPLNVSNAVDDPLLGAAPSVVEHELRSILCAPFRATEDLRGVVVVDHRLRTGAFGPRAERLLGLLADQAALAVGQLRRRAQISDLNRRLSERVARTERDLADARRALEDRGLSTPGGGLVGSSSAMERLRTLIARVAPSGMAVLLRGASGTGKELAARAVHELSERGTGPFVGENVAALPASLIESELFGYRRGAFTGAERDRAGLFERAHGGTLFLDEIGEMPAELQAKLLRVLETRRVRRLGDDEERTVDFRLLTATHRDLESAVASGAFRQDLYYRIAGLEVELPPLAERTEDVPELVEHFLTLEAAATGDRRQIAPAVVERLARRAWPGNVRELRNEVRRLCVLSVGDVTDPSLVRDPAVALPIVSAGGALPTMAELERLAIERALEQTGGDKAEAAKLLGISRAKVYQRLKEWREAGEEPGA